jgi:hypothetical protein
MAEENAPRQAAIAGISELAGAVDEILLLAQRTVRIFDNELGREYNSSSRCEALRRLLLSNRRNRLLIVVHDSQSMDRNCPRLLNLLRIHAHAISIHETHQAAKAVYDPFVVVDDLHHVHRFHFEQPRGVPCTNDPTGTHPFIERFEEIWEASSPAVSATTLGL